MAHILRLLDELCAAAERIDGAAPLDEATWRSLRHDPWTGHSLVVTTDDGALHSGTPAPDSAWSGAALRMAGEVHLVVAPTHRRSGLGGRLLDRLLGDTPPELTLTAWAHGGHPGAARLAATRGFEAVRDLWVLRRPAGVPLPALAIVPGVAVIPYTPVWADEVLRVNAAAFAHHPEQGAMDAEDLARRMDAPWFDPAGLLLAVEARPDADPGAPGSLLGFHWTKRHSARLGEVYVVAVDPSAQGRGLGRLLTLAGLHHLADAGIHDIHLYVEADNAPAVATYTRLGFVHAPSDTHVQYRRPGTPVASR